jgi:hypothetical protein
MGFRRHRTCLEFIAIVMYREDPIGSYSMNILVTTLLVPVLPSLLVSKADLSPARTCASPVSDKNSPRSWHLGSHFARTRRELFYNFFRFLSWFLERHIYHHMYSSKPLTAHQATRDGYPPSERTHSITIGTPSRTQDSTRHEKTRPGQG